MNLLDLLIVLLILAWCFGLPFGGYGLGSLVHVLLLIVVVLVVVRLVTGRQV